MGSWLQRCCQRLYILRQVLLLSLTDSMSCMVTAPALKRSTCMLNCQSFVFYLNLTLTRHYLYITITIYVYKSICITCALLAQLLFRDQFAITCPLQSPLLFTDQFSIICVLLSQLFLTDQFSIACALSQLLFTGHFQIKFL